MVHQKGKGLYSYVCDSILSNASSFKEGFGKLLVSQSEALGTLPIGSGAAKGVALPWGGSFLG